MHDRTRRNLCRCGFVALCVIPTVLTASMACYRQSDLYGQHVVQAWGQQLSRQLGYRVTVDSVTEPSPGVSLVKGVQFFDPETAEAVGSVKSVTVFERRPRNLILLRHVQMGRAELPNLLDAFRFGLQRHPSGVSAPIDVTCDDLTLTSGDGTETAFSSLDASLLSDDARLELKLDFTLANAEIGNPIQVTCIRDRAARPLQTSWEIKTGDASIPCQVFADVVPILKQFGPDATFSGQVTANYVADSWSGNIDGMFASVDLKELTARDRYKLEGSATASLRQAKFLNGQLTKANGDIQVLRGTMGSDLLAIAERSLGVTISQRVLRQNQQPIQFQHLGIGFSIGDGQLTVSGKAHHNFPGVICFDSSGYSLASQHDDRRSTPLQPTFGGQSGFLMQVFGNSLQVTPRIASPPRVDVRRN